MYYGYIIESIKSGKWYYGHSKYPEKRLTEHNAGQNKSTKYGIPWVMIFKKEFESKAEAMKFERYLKSLKNKDYVRKNVIGD